MKLKNKLLHFFLLLIVILPQNVLAYSSYVIPGGETVGIEVNSKGVLVVGFYKVNETYIGRDAGFLVGDKIKKVNNQSIDTIDQMIKIINQNKEEPFTFTLDRDKKEEVITFQLEADTDGGHKTGLYVKDQITGIGTLTYIDPNTKIFGALGHEIIEKTTAEKFMIKDGKIFGANVVGIDKSSRGVAGEKKATYDKENIFGTVNNNAVSGIFGKYTEDINGREKLKVADSSEIKLGKATIRTVVTGDTIETFDINILKLDNSNETKNILFEIVDEKLINTSGGVVQGMSGSPIIQDDKIIGAVTHVIVNDSTKGYGILITTMLKEGEN